MPLDLQKDLGKLSHHAYVLVGNSEIGDELKNYLHKNFKVKIIGNSDLIEKSFESLAIDDARQLKESASTRPVSENANKYFIVQANTINVEAQNALLKLIEEPNDYAKFFFIIPTAHILLPTVLSRVSLIDLTANNSKSISADAKEFVKLAKGKRLEFIKGLLEEVNREKKTKQEILNFIDELEVLVYKDLGPKKGLKELQSLEIARKYAYDRAPSFKMLLEYIALNI